MKNAILFHIFLLCICCMACTGTTKEPVADVTLDELPSIFPDYADVTIPHISLPYASDCRSRETKQ